MVSDQLVFLVSGRRELHQSMRPFCRCGLPNPMCMRLPQCRSDQLTAKTGYCISLILVDLRLFGSSALSN